MNKRVAGLRRLFAKNRIDGIFITQPENCRYLSGFDGSPGYLFITPDKTVLATDFRYTEQARQQAPDFEILRIGGKLAEWFPALVGDAGIGRLGFEAEITFEFHRQLGESLKKKGVAARLVPTAGLVKTMRAVKEPAELKLIAAASAITDAAMAEIGVNLKAGMTEKQAAWALEKHMRENGAEAMNFEIIVASGPNAARPHHRPTDRSIGGGDAVVIDMGARVGGYGTDFTRTICAGRPAAQFKKVYNTVLKAQMAAIARITGGMTGHEADAIAREIIKQAGYGEAFGHALGHGVGLEVHEAPRLGPDSKDVLKEGMVFTVEPGIYLTGWGGVRIEDTVVLEKGKVRPITRATKERY